MKSVFMAKLGEAERDEEKVEQLDAEEWSEEAAHAVEKDIAAEHCGGAGGTILHAAERERNEGDDDEGVEHHRAEDGALRRMEAHDVERLERPARGAERVEQAEHCGENREVFRDVIGDAERGERAARHEQLLSDF